MFAILICMCTGMQFFRGIYGNYSFTFKPYLRHIFSKYKNGLNTKLQIKVNLWESWGRQSCRLLWLAWRSDPALCALVPVCRTFKINYNYRNLPMQAMLILCGVGQLSPEGINCNLKLWAVACYVPYTKEATPVTQWFRSRYSPDQQLSGSDLVPWFFGSGSMIFVHGSGTGVMPFQP